ncbi:MAG: hypothetical protein KJP21_08090 [Bacteroidia bacterium]|nr:hypothetical protein [Bacteroidia bacterium]NNJ56543.1 hypothetical protein [Bacteroidia bacterium]
MASQNLIVRKVNKKGIVFGLFLLVIGVIISYTSCTSQSSEITYLNHNPETKYMGMEVCASCHGDKHSTFVHTGMGLSFDSATRSKSSAIFGPEHVIEDSASGLSYYPFWRDEKLFIREFQIEKEDTVHQLEVQVDYIVGSGQHTNSHLFTEDGYIYQAPITFYVQKQKWDLAPGFEKGNNSRFNRLLNAECISCHNAMPEVEPNTEFKFKRIGNGIDCERCHGPGELHVEQRLKNEGVDVSEEIDPTIVNPGKLSVAKQIDLCQRCHLQGLNILKDGMQFTDFKPGMDLKDVFEVYLPSYEGENSEFDMANHAQRLQMSRCYIDGNKDDQALTCITCHNPHISVKSTGSGVYNKACLNCHSDESCSENEQNRIIKSNNCVSCHMPQTGSEDIPHVSVHDHKIGKPISKDNVQKVKKLIGLYAVNNPNPENYYQTKAYLEYWEKFDKNPIYLQKAKDLLSSGVHNNLWLKYYYLVENWNKATELKLDDTKLTSWELFMLGESYGKLRNNSQAVYYIKKAYQEDRTNPNIALKLIDYLIKVGKLSEGMEIAKASSQEFSNNGLIKNSIAQLYILQGNLAKAEVWLKEARKLEPLNLKVWETHLNYAINSGDESGFRFWAVRIISKYPDHPSKNEIEKLLQ